MPTDSLLTNAYQISNDHYEQVPMQPYPAHGPLYVTAYPREPDYTVGFFDSMFQTNEPALLTNVRLLKPRFVSIGTLATGRSTARERIRASKGMGCIVIPDGPDPLLSQDRADPPRSTTAYLSAGRAGFLP